ncbi:zinc finger protein 79-like isoform X2 [Myripristis murdjan]|uniref:zinc finger protein 79-like isoform X2 n=1 Tax=Myripristis murdjan TaxID=586833 RepID=UPI001176438D|nr:zinc finger protein 79-like isoform X2 [Myripristis murdjan]
MSELRELSSLVWRRQAAAAARISELMDGALADYKKQISRLKKDNKRQRKLLDALLHPGARLFPTVLPKQLLVYKEEKQEWRPSVDQEQPEPPHVKEEQQELWASQEAEQLQDIKFPLTAVTLKSEDDEEEAGPSQLHQSQTEESREAEPPASSSTVKMETEAAGEEPAGNVDPAVDLQPACNGQLLSSHSSDSEADDSEDDMEEAGEAQSRSSSVSEVLVSLGRSVIREKPFSCSFCSHSFSKKCDFNRHQRVHTGEKPFSCSVCHKSFRDKTYLKVHVRVHTGERPFRCSECHKSFSDKRVLQRHMRVHTREKPFSCSECDKSFSEKRILVKHMRFHTGETVQLQCV